jgi:hypothetical protein
MREVRRMQNTVRAELDTVLHPDVTPPDPSHATPDAIPGAIPGAIEDTDHSTIPAPAPENYDEGFAGPRSFT